MIKNIKKISFVILVSLTCSVNAFNVKRFARHLLGDGVLYVVFPEIMNDILEKPEYYRAYNGYQNKQDNNNKKNEKSVDNQKITFKDIAGIDNVIKEVTAVVDFIKNPEKYKKLGAELPKGILLQGPPGNGKTLLAQAIANEAGFNFYTESASAFVELYVGAGAKKIRELFDKARNNKPAIIFIDEIDAIGAANRGIGGNEEYRQTLNQLLVELDGFSKDNSVIILAATNNADALDSALKRPGRFTKIINIPLPDEKARRDILNLYIKKLPIFDITPETMTILINRSLGFSAAELKNIVNEATLRAVELNAQKVTNEHFIFGLEKTEQRRNY